MRRLIIFGMYFAIGAALLCAWVHAADFYVATKHAGDGWALLIIAAVVCVFPTVAGTVIARLFSGKEHAA